MTRLLYFTTNQEGRRKGVSVLIKDQRESWTYTLFQYLEKADALNLEVGGSDEQEKYLKPQFYP